MKRIDVTLGGGNDYELLDCGEGRKLERFGSYVLDRPDPQAIWNKTNTESWLEAHAQFLWADKGERWKVMPEVKESWSISINEVHLVLSFKGFKHIGVFPEHAHQWKEIQELGAQKGGMKMLNLFGYTGAASVAGAKAGMEVTHVDASKQTLATLKENMNLSGLPDDAIRVICEDALRYAKRLVEREEKFEVIVMDPPAFGRGPKGEVWKIEEKLPELIALIPKLLSPDAQLVIINGYAAGFSARTFGELLGSILPKEKVVYGDVGITQTNSDRILSTGIYTKWQK
jgi:23S rRNA (cytosine1962-C5)-methyltransferase